MCIKQEFMIPFSKKFTAVCIILFMLSCNSQKPASVQSSSMGGNSMVSSDKNQIVFLFFTIEKTDNGGEKVNLTESRITEGTLKEMSINNAPPRPGNLIITLLSANGEEVEHRIIEDPLNPVLESYEEGGINKQQANFERADFSIRFNRKGNISSVRVEKISNNSKSILFNAKI